MANRNWNRDELILTIRLYCETPFGKMHKRNPEVDNLAQKIGRTPSSVAYKLVNFASLDPSLRKRGVKGMGNTSKLDKEIWNEFYGNWDDLVNESEKIQIEKEQHSIEHDQLSGDEWKSNEEQEQLVKRRINQGFFRNSVLASYNNTCCITGMKIPSVLIAGHIVPWAENPKHRLNPRNGICINALHDRAFENGLIAISSDYKILVSRDIKEKFDSNVVKDYFVKYENQEIILPSRFSPEKEFLDTHYEKFKDKY